MKQIKKKNVAKTVVTCTNREINCFFLLFRQEDKQTEVRKEKFKEVSKDFNNRQKQRDNQSSTNSHGPTMDKARNKTATLP